MINLRKRFRGYARLR